MFPPVGSARQDAGAGPDRQEAKAARRRSTAEAGRRGDTADAARRRSTAKAARRRNTADAARRRITTEAARRGNRRRPSVAGTGGGRAPQEHGEGRQPGQYGEEGRPSCRYGAGRPRYRPARRFGRARDICRLPQRRRRGGGCGRGRIFSRRRMTPASSHGFITPASGRRERLPAGARGPAPAGTTAEGALCRRSAQPPAGRSGQATRLRPMNTRSGRLVCPESGTETVPASSKRRKKGASISARSSSRGRSTMIISRPA